MGAVSNGAAAGPDVDGFGGATVIPLTSARRRRAAPRSVSWPHPSRVTELGRVTEPAVEQATVTLKVAAERQRIAGLIHDDVSSLLFAMAAGVQRAEALHSDDVDEMRAALARVSEQVVEVSDRLRAVLRSCTPAEPTEGVPTSAQRDLDDFTQRSGIAAHLVVRGRARSLSASAERVSLNCLRQALFNIERHARAGVVIVTLDYTPDELSLIVQDDGQGLPAGFEPRVVPESGHHWGFASMARQVEQRGGQVELTDVEDGGTRLRVRLPA
jgi:Signal transduction histidine kinase